MDPYFRPILISSLIVILLNTVLSLPLMGFPILTYLVGGIIAVVLFRNDKVKETNNENFETKNTDAIILGIATGILVGSFLTFIMALNLNNPEIKQAIIDQINERMKMNSQIEFNFLEDLGPSFYLIFGVVSIFFTTIVSLFGSLMTMVFVNKSKK
jgi:hypothetical protein